jgi:hypothetical protein
MNTSRMSPSLIHERKLWNYILQSSEKLTLTKTTHNIKLVLSNQ